MIMTADSRHLANRWSTRTVSTHVVDTPVDVKALYPLPTSYPLKIMANRDAIEEILTYRDPRYLVIVGPCSIRSVTEALDYASRLKALANKVGDKMFVVMRAYFEKPRTSLGWKGIVNDPGFDGGCDLAKGHKLAREIAVGVAGMGLPIATEILNPLSFQYFEDCVSWACVGARNAESPTIREVVSGLPMPVGFKNATDGSAFATACSMKACKEPHTYLGIGPSGTMISMRTEGNICPGLVLRGGRSGPNYSGAPYDDAVQALHATNCLTAGIMVDCSHGNSGKDWRRQAAVLKDVVGLVRTGKIDIRGFMFESDIVAGKQEIPENLRGFDSSKLVYGQSVTDGCVGWEETEAMLMHAYENLPHRF